MPLYSYKATDSSGKIVQETLEATDEMAAVASIQEKGYIPIRVTLGGGGKKLLSSDLTGPISSFINRVSGKDVMMFTQDLATLLEAGLPVDRALTILADVSEKDQFKLLVRDILRIVQGGGSLSDAFAKYPNAFSKFYVNMVRAGEAGGILESVLKRLGLFLESSQDLKDYIKSALVYPIFLLFVGGISIIILMTYVIPRFSIIFSDLGGAIPLSTQILLAASNILRSYWWLLILLIVSGCFCIYRYKTTPSGQVAIDKMKLKLPVAKDFVQKLEVSRFTRTLGTLIKSGVPILESLNLVKGIISNKVIRDALSEVHERVKEGERLSKPLEDTGVFPSLAIQMITVGEETGKLEEMLLRVADNYEKILKNMVRRLIGFLEPAMILVMGVVVAFIVISMLMAIFSMNEIPF
jgi:type II secretion system protein F